MKSPLLVLLFLVTSTIATQTVVTKKLKISGKSFKCVISISHGCVTTLTTNVKCSPGKPKSIGSIRFTEDGYTFQVDFQTPSKVIKTQLLGVPCPKCPCKSKLCSPPCPTRPAKPEKPAKPETTQTTTKPVTNTTDKTTMTENKFTTTTIEETIKTTAEKIEETTTTELLTTTTESITTSEDKETTAPSISHRGQEKTKISLVTVKVGPTKFKCSFILAYTGKVVSTKGSSGSCSPKNKYATAKNIRLKADNGCKFVVSFNIKYGEVINIKGRADCPVPATREPTTTTKEPTTKKETTTTREPTTTKEPTIATTTTKEPVEIKSTTTTKEPTTAKATTTKEPTTKKETTTTREPTTTEEPVEMKSTTTTKEPTTAKATTTTKEPTTAKELKATKVPTTTGQTTTQTEGTSTVGRNTTLPRSVTSTPPPSEIKELKCGCHCDCPEDGSDCSCVCDCPKLLVSAPPTCATGFTKICPMRKNSCPENMHELCSPNARRQEESEETQERELTDRTLTVVTKTVKISGKSFKCAISISHGCVTTLTTSVKCSPGKPKSLGSIQFTKDGYTFQVDFQTPSKVIKTQLLAVPCPKCSCKSKLCSPPCPTKPSKPSKEETETTQTTTEAKKPTMTENTFSTTTIGETTKKHSTDTTTEAKKPVTKTTDKTTTTENILSTTTKEQTTTKTSTDTTTKEQTTKKTSTDTTTKEQTTKKTSTDTTTKEQTTKKAATDTITTERVNETTATESITTTEDQETSASPTPSFYHRGQPGGFDEGCTCVPNFILFFSQHFLMQKDYQPNGFIAACYCVEEDNYTMQPIMN